jgi:hypothetical protein
MIYYVPDTKQIHHRVSVFVFRKKNGYCIVC